MLLRHGSVFYVLDCLIEITAMYAIQSWQRTTNINFSTGFIDYSRLQWRVLCLWNKDAVPSALRSFQRNKGYCLPHKIRPCAEGGLLGEYILPRIVVIMMVVVELLFSFSFVQEVTLSFLAVLSSTAPGSLIECEWRTDRIFKWDVTFSQHRIIFFFFLSSITILRGWRGKRPRRFSGVLCTGKWSRIETPSRIWGDW